MLPKKEHGIFRFIVLKALQNSPAASITKDGAHTCKHCNVLRAKHSDLPTFPSYIPLYRTVAVIVFFVVLADLTKDTARIAYSYNI